MRKKPCRIQTRPQADYSFSFSIQSPDFRSVAGPVSYSEAQCASCLPGPACFLLQCEHEQMCPGT